MAEALLVAVNTPKIFLVRVAAAARVESIHALGHEELLEICYVTERRVVEDVFDVAHELSRARALSVGVHCDQGAAARHA